MCPAHSRRLIDEAGEGPLLTRMMRAALAGAGDRLRGGLPGPCPACDAAASASAGALRVVVDALLDDGNAELYRQHEGMCLEHVLSAAATAQSPTLKILCERLLTSMREADNLAPELLAGMDYDAPRRARWRAELPVWPAGRSTLEAVYAGLDIDACPVCLASGLMDRRYGQWFIERAHTHDPSITRDPGELCAIHLHDLARVDRQALRIAIARKRANQIGKLSAVLDRLGSMPAPAPARRSRRAPADPIQTAREEFISTLHCPACRARDVVDRRQLELICASLALRPVRERYEHSHGLCLGHVTQMPEGDAAKLARRHLDARLRVLAWEVDETARKYAWACRHEAAGPERSAPLRALVQINGRVFEGGPAPDRADRADRTAMEHP